jgi:hypothetical protein
MICLLHAHSGDRWASWLTKRQDRIVDGDGLALLRLRDWFGASEASTTCTSTQPTATVSDVGGINQQLRDLRAKVWTSLQRMLRRRVDSG